MKLLDPDHPFFRRPLARWLTVALPLAWGGVEFWNGAPVWGGLFWAAGLYALWVLVLARR